MWIFDKAVCGAR